MASPVDTSVKWAHSSHAGAPVMTGTAGTRLAALRAFLVTGYGNKTVDSGTISGGKCRLNFASGASAAAINSVILVAGAAPTDLNGEQKITSVSTTWVEFATALPDGPVSGSVTFKIAPLGWEEVFTKTNVSVFRPTDPHSTRPFYRVDDSGPIYTDVRMYEDMTDVDTGVNGTAGRSWNVPWSAGTVAARWALAGDSRGFYIAMAPFSTQDTTPNINWAAAVSYLGDCISDRSGDAYAGVVTGMPSGAGGSSGVGSIFSAETEEKGYLMRVAAGVSTAVLFSVMPATGTRSVSGNDVTFGPFPSRTANALFLVPILLADGSNMATVGRRGSFPGALHCPQTGLVSAIANAPSQLKGTGDYAGKTLLPIHVSSTTGQQGSGVGFIDITGPWR